MSLPPTIENIPALIDRAKRELDEARDIGAVLRVRDAAEALAGYTKRRKRLLAAHNRLMGILALCERKIGTELAAMRKHPPGPAPKIGNSAEPIPEEPPTLAELGLTKRQSAEFQVLARVPDTVILDAIAVAGAEGRPASRRDYLAAAKGLTADGIGNIEAANVQWVIDATKANRMAVKFGKWVTQGSVFVTVAGTYLLDHPGDLRFSVQPSEAEVLANFLFKVANVVRAEAAARPFRPRPAPVVVDFPANGAPDEPKE